MSNEIIIEPYSANISVTFSQYPPFLGKVYVKGDGNFAVFDWPTQAATEATVELAAFKTRTKWVTNKSGCTKSGFTDPDPNFMGMVSHAGYERTQSSPEQNVYSKDAVTCTYRIDEQGREVISSIVFEGARVEFTNVVFSPQDPALFEQPDGCKET